MPRTDVLIVGAGPTGLVLALWLTRLGVRVRIIDRTAEPGTTSRALAVQARTLELYRQLDLAAAVVEAGHRIAAINLWVSGSKAARVPLGAIGEGLSPYPYALTYPQDLHERLLIDRLAAVGVQVERRTTLLSLRQSGAGVTATVSSDAAPNATIEAAYLAGCDGAHSTVREQIGVGFPGSTYDGVFYVADVDASGPAADGELHVELDAADFLAVFPLKGSGRLRLIGPVRRADFPDSAEPTFGDVRERATGHLKLRIDRANWFSTYHVHHRVAERFSDGRVFLLGDAAHIHSPVGGQGMNTGIGDAINLAWKLAAAVRGRAGGTLLSTYDEERIGFARRLVATTDRAFTIVTKRGEIARWIRTRLVPFVAPWLLRSRSVQRMLFRTASQIGVTYRDSRLSEGQAGRVFAGDRLPWIELETGSDNYTPLDSMQWQVHVYGAASDVIRDACARVEMPMHVFAWRDAMARAGIARDALYLMRPDGYVAFADPRAQAVRFDGYCRRTGLTRLRSDSETDRATAAHTGRA